MATEFLGIIAASLVVVSFTFKKPLEIRTANLFGAVLFIIYGFLIESVSVWFLNTVLVFVQLYHIRELLERK